MNYNVSSGTLNPTIRDLLGFLGYRAIKSTVLNDFCYTVVDVFIVADKLVQKLPYINVSVPVATKLGFDEVILATFLVKVLY